MVVVLGGTGSLLGTILAAMMIGIFSSVIEFSTTATIAKALVFVMIVAFLQWRPTGLVTQRAR